MTVTTVVVGNCFSWCAVSWAEMLCFAVCMRLLVYKITKCVQSADECRRDVKIFKNKKDKINKKRGVGRR